ncbi:hypothetical protein C0Q70_11289 [Pomacea canaliculata]|uniref:Uncharacterized protein n=1 Tax=Pomacea canaliculata TaxID=400727 RepID=A0A2T7P5J2_POMCA|nr:hypothetical protein C0Q70_11289 [Pomacea canaliculata]
MSSIDLQVAVTVLELTVDIDTAALIFKNCSQMMAYLATLVTHHSRFAFSSFLQAGGTVFYQGDIIVDSNVARFIYPSLYSKKRRHKRATVRMRKRLWKNGVVPYIFTDTLSEPHCH